ncbi:hypothetical protein NIES4071_108290 (plasmid) [Calothrix sp. NIES-4071]|nr:hypothetical protein NIES4071_108290 [Calothrix sp. NIES-4071]BAZ64869.1 hypothetical protein NIES4105_106020 [Calothrix sp. NIES-4105]
MKIAFTGTRNTDKNQSLIIRNKLQEIALIDATWYVGDAMGLDALVRIEAKRLSKELNIYVCQGKERYDFAKRSKQMVDAICGANSKLYAFANKACPSGCKPCKNPTGEGSGTWLTIAYAHYHGVPVEIIFLRDGLVAPDWLCSPTVSNHHQQLTLW